MRQTWITDKSRSEGALGCSLLLTAFVTGMLVGGVLFY